MSSSDLLTRLRAHRMLEDAPERELEWIAAHGRVRTFDVGDDILPPDLRVEEMLILLSGQIAMYIDRGAGPRRTMERRGGDVTGLLPYSRLTHSPSMPRVEKRSEMLAIHRDDFPELIRECPTVTAELVHHMVDRARGYTQHDLYDEKMLSLGRLAAGLAHELDNPASAVLRSAKTVSALMDDVDRAAAALREAGASPAELVVIGSLRDFCSRDRAQPARSPLDQARHEEAISNWIEARGIGPEEAELLADMPITVEMLGALEESVQRAVLQPAIRWVAAASACRRIMREIGDAAGRISALVKSVKAFTHMDESGARPVDIRQGIADTAAVLESRAKGKSVRVRIDVEPTLPTIHGVGGELNQVWSNLIENALDAVPQGGTVDVTARQEEGAVMVRVIDNGPGIPREHQERVFEPFFTTKPVGEGTGLGLDIVRRLVARQSGTVELFSSPGRTEFRVTLPL